MKNIAILICVAIIIAPLSLANGGCIKVADDILVQMSVAPHVPIVNEKASFLFSFGNESGLIREEISGKMRIVQNDKTLLAREFKAKDGILDLKHEFNNPGLYEIFLEFNFKNKTYAPEDFLIEVKEESNASEIVRTRSQLSQNFVFNFIFLIVGIIVGMVIMKLIKNNKIK